MGPFRHAKIVDPKERRKKIESEKKSDRRSEGSRGERLGEPRAAERWRVSSDSPPKKKKNGNPFQQKAKVGDRKKKKKSKKKKSAGGAESCCRAAEGRMARRARCSKQRERRLGLALLALPRRFGVVRFAQRGGEKGRKRKAAGGIELIAQIDGVHGKKS
jgi:hypothetical protein